MMQHVPPAFQYLITATRLPHDRTLCLFHVGYPWPIFRGPAVTKLGTELQAKRLSLDATHAPPLTNPRTCLQELRDHVLNVVFATGVLPEILFHLWRALQIYAIEHPDWSQDELMTDLGLNESRPDNRLTI